MVQSKAATVEQYLAELPPEQREAIVAVRKVILDSLPGGYEEVMTYGMIGYVVPHSLYPPGYHCDPTKPLGYACLAAQKNYMSVYLMCVYGDEKSRQWFVKEYKATGKKLDMGQSCIRFKKLDDLPLELIGKAVARVSVDKMIAFYENARKQLAARKRKGPVGRNKTRGKKAASAKRR